MPDKKLTDNEIVKALECCSKDEINGLNIFTYGGVPMRSLLRYALDLINRLQADAENYKQIAEHQQSVTMDRGFEIKKLKAENERLNFVRTRDAQKYNEKISDQAHTNCVLYDLYDKAIKEVKELEGKLKTAKAEAYKECIDLVKKKGVKVGVDEICIFENTLDNLSKELVGTDFTQMFMGVKKLEPIPNNEKELVGEDK